MKSPFLKIISGLAFSFSVIASVSAKPIISRPPHIQKTTWQNGGNMPVVPGANAVQDLVDNPTTVQVLVGASFNVIGVAGVSLADATNEVNQDFSDNCGLGANVLGTEILANMRPYQIYPLVIWGEDEVANMGITEVQIPSNLPRPTSGGQTGGDLIQHYRLYARVAGSDGSSTNWQPFCKDNFPLFDCSGDGGGECCVPQSITMYIQLRPDGSARPLTLSSGRDENEDGWSRDESPIDMSVVPGDGEMVTMSAGNSTGNPASINFQWSIDLGRLWSGASAGKVRFLGQTLSDGSAYASATLNYAPRSSDTNEVNLLYASGTTNVIQQIKTPQVFVNVNGGITATATITATTNHGYLSNAVVTGSGGRYGWAPTVTIHDSHGSNGIVTAQISQFGNVTNLVISNVGTNYTTNATLSLAAPTKGFSVDCYLPSVITGVNPSGYYTFNSSSQPFVSWWVDSPDTSNNKWRLQEIRNGGVNLASLQYNSTNLTWTLTQGNGSEARTEIRTIQTNTTGGYFTRTETDVVQNAGASVSEQSVEVYQQLPWGFELTSQTTDSTGANLQTTFAFGTDSGSPAYNQLISTQYPDGYWEQRVYADDTVVSESFDTIQYGALFQTITPWLNGLSTDSVDSNLVTEVDPVSPWGSQDYRQVKFHNASAYGEGLAADVDYYHSGCYVEQHFVGEDDCGSISQIEEFHSVGMLDNESEIPESKDTITYGPTAGRLANQTFHYVGFEQTGYHIETYDYIFGHWNPTSLTFSTNTGATNDELQIIYHGTSYPEGFNIPNNNGGEAAFDQLVYGDSGVSLSVDGDNLLVVPFQSTKDVKILQNGNLAAKYTYVYLGDGTPNEYIDWNSTTNFALIDETIYQRDILGHATNVYRIDPKSSVHRTLYTADWTGGNTWPADLKFFSSDEMGVTTTFAYDSLKRPVTKTRVGLSVTGYPSQSSIVTSLSFDASGRVLTNSTTAGSLTQKTISAFDRSGRVTSVTTPDQLTTSYSYLNGGLHTNITYSSGASITISNYLDRRIKSVTGVAATNQYYQYGQFYWPDENAWPGCPGFAPENTTTITLGSIGSGRWTEQISDKRYQPTETLQPAFHSANDLSLTYVRRSPFYEYTIQSSFEDGSGSPTYQTTYFGYDQVAQPCYQELQVDGSYAADLTSMDRGTTNSCYYALDGSGAWFKVSASGTYLTDGSPVPTIQQTVWERQTGFTSGQAEETKVYDVYNNLTDTNVTIDYPNAKVTTTVTVPQSTLAATSVAVNGLLQTESTPTVSAPTWHFYDALGRETGTTDPLGFSTTTSYDPVTGRKTAQTDPAGNLTQYYYYAAGGTNAGMLQYEVNALGNKTYYGYDGCGRLIHQWGDVPYPQERAYNAYGDLVTLHTYRAGSNWNGSTWPSSPGTADTTTWSYDTPTGLLTNKTDAAGRSVVYSYYNNRLLQSCAWARGVSYTNLYNPQNDLIAVQYSDATPTVVYTNQDRRGLPRGISDASGDATLAYDLLGRTTNQTWTAGLFNTLSISNHFDTVRGRDALAALGLSSKVETDYGYDTFGRMKTVAANSNRVGYAYLPNSDLLQTTISSNATGPVLTATRQWDDGFRLRSIANVVSNTTVTSHAYAYDALNRRTSATLEDGSAWRYAYNNRNELTGAGRYWADWTPVTGQQYGYGYDNIGNRALAQSGSLGSLRNATYGVNNLNEYTNIATPGFKDIIGVALATNPVTINGNAADRKVEYFHRETTVTNASGPVWHPVAITAGGTTNGGLVFPANSQPLTYDADGNLTFDGIWTYAWDAENRLASMTMTNVGNIAATNRLKLTFAYDEMGRRISKTVGNWSGSAFTNYSTNFFTYDGWNTIAIFGPKTNIQQSFIWGLDLSATLSDAGGVGGMVIANELGTIQFTGYNGNGDVLVQISDAKDVSARYEYSPFGETLRASGPLSQQNSFRFSTKLCDLEDALAYYGHRFYSPATGRWISRDPIDEMGGNNLVAFVKNAATGAIDPLGNLLLDNLFSNTAESGEKAYEYKRGQSFVNMIRTVIKDENNLQQFEAGVEEAEGLDLSDLMQSIQAAQGALSQGLRGAKSSIRAISQLDNLHHIFPQAKKLAQFFKNNNINVNSIKASINGYVHQFGIHAPGTGGIYNQIWKDFAATQGDSSNPYFVLGFGVGLFDQIAPTVVQ